MKKNPFLHQREIYKTDRRINLEKFAQEVLEAGSRATISRIENGKYPKSFYILKRYRQCGASLDKIFDSINIKDL